MSIQVLIACFSVFLCAMPQVSQQGKAQGISEAESARRFVQLFYGWYVPRALAVSDKLQSAWGQALKKRGADFSPPLSDALAADLRAQTQATAGGYIVGLDFDPFLAAQDPCKQYEVGVPVRKGKHYWVPIYGVCSGKRHLKADVIAEVGSQPRGSWVFVDFHYPGNGPDLLGTLKLLSQERAGHSGWHRSRRYI